MPYWARDTPALAQHGPTPARASDLPEEGCGTPIKALGHDGRLAGLAVCRHQHVPADSLSQTWDAAAKFTLTMRLREADTRAAADDLLTQWHDHLAAASKGGQRRRHVGGRHLALP